MHVLSYLRDQEKLAPASIKSFYATFENLFNKKLWHQLTVEIEAFCLDTASTPALVSLYEQFVSEFQKELNQLSLARFLVTASKTLSTPALSLAFLAPHLDRLKQDSKSQSAYTLLAIECAGYTLATGNTETCLASIKECEALIDSTQVVDPAISAAFYRISADYYKAKAAYPLYYHNALLYLSVVKIESLTGFQRVERAHDLAISALLGEGLYNFGELLLHPILDALKSSGFEWMRTLLFTFNSGDMDAFAAIASGADFKKMSLFMSSYDFIKKKLCIMTLVESVFKRSKEQRMAIGFAALSTECRVGPGEVEHLVMKALSLGLIKGSIDEVDQTIQVTWIQPRVLDKDQIKVMMARLGEWVNNVKDRVASLKEHEGVFVC